jgi:hypothetical protein
VVEIITLTDKLYIDKNPGITRVHKIGASMASIDNRNYWMIILILSLLLTACTDFSEDITPSETQASLQGRVLLNVYKNPTCGCCGEWVKHIENNGITAQTHDTEKLGAVKDRYGINPQYWSCHTAVSSDGFVFEGHVPARYVQQFLNEKPGDAIGLAVPAMPVGSPGMELEDKFMQYQVLLLKTDGSSEVYVDIQTKDEQY